MPTTPTIRKKRVLVVEDQVVPEGEAMQMNLEDAGYNVIGIAETPEMAVKLANDRKPSIVVMDISLQKDGLAGVRIAKEIQDAIGAQIVFTTGVLVDADLLEEVRKVKEFQFLTKPVALEQLLASMHLAEMKFERKRTVFLCYSHDDRAYAEEWRKHMEMLHDVGIQPFVDTQIGFGLKWKIEIENALSTASGAVCLVSESFVKSKFVRKVELPKLLRAADSDGRRIIPVFVEPIAAARLRPLGLLNFQGANRPEDPISSWSALKRASECWIPLCEMLQEL